MLEELSLNMTSCSDGFSLDADNCQYLRIEAHRFRLYGDGVGAANGDLDKAVERPSSMRSTILSFLRGFAQSL